MLTSITTKGSYVSILTKNSIKYTLFTLKCGPWNKDLGSSILSRNGMTAQAKPELYMFCYIYNIGGNFFYGSHFALRYMTQDHNTQVWVTCDVDDGTPLEILTGFAWVSKPCSSSYLSLGHATLGGKALFISQLSNQYLHCLKHAADSFATWHFLGSILSST